MRSSIEEIDTVCKGNEDIRKKRVSKHRYLWTRSK